MNSFINSFELDIKKSELYKFFISLTNVDYIVNIKEKVIKQIQHFARFHDYAVIIKRIKNYRNKSCMNTLYEIYL